MHVTRSETIALATVRCESCRRLGLIETDGAGEPCTCVERAIFQACHTRFMDTMLGASTTEEFAACFYLVCRRTLTEDEHCLFKAHYLIGIEPKAVARQVNMAHDKLLDCYAGYELRLGRAFRDAGLFPIDGFLSGTACGGMVPATVFRLEPA